ncbi:hypothetical protein Airi02_101490 [Actinoallomurus iriomotensis]|uniref:Uncharacterized protein n=1 Tax=Actinoallomurus iriomotensis TaxID=478107 RepID=A0A9W6SEQ8_9ACTN|nr:hypothetical protein Airi02_101490 [Actinoallomurus iriomotensis]
MIIVVDRALPGRVPAGQVAGAPVMVRVGRGAGRSGFGFNGGRGGTLQWWLCAHGSAWLAPESCVVTCVARRRDAAEALVVTV